MDLVKRPRDLADLVLGEDPDRRHLGVDLTVARLRSCWTNAGNRSPATSSASLRNRRSGLTSERTTPVVISRTATISAAPRRGDQRACAASAPSAWLRATMPGACRCSTSRKGSTATVAASYHSWRRPASRVQTPQRAPPCPEQDQLAQEGGAVGGLPLTVSSKRRRGPRRWPRRRSPCARCVDERSAEERSICSRRTRPRPDHREPRPLERECLLGAGERVERAAPGRRARRLALPLPSSSCRESRPVIIGSRRRGRRRAAASTSAPAHAGRQRSSRRVSAVSTFPGTAARPSPSRAALARAPASRTSSTRVPSGLSFHAYLPSIPLVGRPRAMNRRGRSRSRPAMGERADMVGEPGEVVDAR